MENQAKKYFNVLRNNEDLSYGGLRTLKMIEHEFDNLHRQILALSNVSGSSEGWVCQKCGQTVNGSEVTYEVYHDECGGKCVWDITANGRVYMQYPCTEL